MAWEEWGAEDGTMWFIIISLAFHLEPYWHRWAVQRTLLSNDRQGFSVGRPLRLHLAFKLPGSRERRCMKSRWVTHPGMAFAWDVSQHSSTATGHCLMTISHEVPAGWLHTGHLTLPFCTSKFWWSVCLRLIYKDANSRNHIWCAPLMLRWVFPELLYSFSVSSHLLLIKMISGEWNLWGIVLPQLEDTVKSGHATVSTCQRTMLKACW